MRSDKRLTEQEFEAVLPHMDRTEERNIQALKRILVDCEMQKTLAAELGITKAAVSLMVIKTWQLHIDHGTRPEGFVMITVTLPEELAEAVKDIERRAHEKAKRKTP